MTWLNGQSPLPLKDTKTNGSSTSNKQCNDEHDDSFQ